jgi:hypothetical protein
MSRLVEQLPAAEGLTDAAENIVTTFHLKEFQDVKFRCSVQSQSGILTRRTKLSFTFRPHLP